MILTLPDEMWARFTDAARVCRGLQVLSKAVRNEDNTIKTPEVLETPDQLGRRILAEFVQNEIRSGERQKAYQTAKIQTKTIEQQVDETIPNVGDIIK